MEAITILYFLFTLWLQLVKMSQILSFENFTQHLEPRNWEPIPTHLRVSRRKIYQLALVPEEILVLTPLYCFVSSLGFYMISQYS